MGEGGTVRLVLADRHTIVVPHVGGRLKTAATIHGKILLSFPREMGEAETILMSLFRRF